MRKIISHSKHYLSIVCVLLGISPASDCDLPTFRNSVSSIFKGWVYSTEWVVRGESGIHTRAKISSSWQDQ
jgi:hypothetical protein